MKTKIFCDSADYKTIKKLNKNFSVDGFTTNPSLMKLSGAKNYKKYSTVGGRHLLQTPTPTDFMGWGLLSVEISVITVSRH